MVHMAHHRHHRVAGLQVLFGFLFHAESRFLVFFHQLGFITELVGQNLDGLEVQAGVDGHHHAHFHALRNDAGGHLVHKAGQFAHGNKVGCLENLLLFAGITIVVFLAINFLDRFLGQVGHHAGNVLANHFLLLFLLLFLSVAGISTAVFVISMTTVLALGVTALSTLGRGSAKTDTAVTGVEGVLHGTAGESAGTASTETAATAVLTATEITTAIVLAVTSIAGAESSRVTLGIALRATTGATRTAVVWTATALLLLLGLGDTGKDGRIGLKHLGLHGRLFQLRRRSHHGGFCRLCRSGLCRSRGLRVRLYRGFGLDFGLFSGLDRSRVCYNFRLL